VATESAGLLVYREVTPGVLEVLLAHPGGPNFAKKDEGAWTIPKGAPNPDETLLETAVREFFEEIGVMVAGPFLELGAIRQRSGKTVHAWAAEASILGPLPVSSNEFELEWPPRSGRRQRFPEVDRADFFSIAEAKTKILAAQQPLIERLLQARAR
jgi:predicted NUDIX family NTP pyrophosphohydrolase